MADSKNNKQDPYERGFRWLDIAAIAGLLLLSVVLVLAFTLWMVTVAKVYGQSSEDFRNWMLGFATMGAGYFWWGRNRALKQQAETDRIRLIDERFSDAVKLLSQNDENGKPAIATRIGGIFMLEKLAKNFDSEYLAQVVKTLIAYIKENIQLTAKMPLAESKPLEKTRSLGEDVKTAFDVIGKLLGLYKQRKMEQFGLSIDNFNFYRHDFSWLFLSLVEGIDFCNYILASVDMRGAMLVHLDFRGASLSYAKLRESFLGGANLQGVILKRAELQGADLSDAKLLYADFSGAELDADTKLPSCSEEIWHSDQEEFKKQGIESRAWGAEWDLSPFSDSADSLIGVLRGYAYRYDFLSKTEDQKLRAKKLRQAARELKKCGKIPKGFPRDWWSWLGKVKKDGSHPDDSYFA